MIGFNDNLGFNDHPFIPPPVGSIPAYYDPGESDQDYFIRNQSAVRALLGVDHAFVTKNHTHIADIRRARTTVTSAIQAKLDHHAAKKLDWTDVDEAGYKGALALIKCLDKDIKSKEREIKLDGSPENGGGFIFGKGQSIANVERGGKYSGVGVGDLLRGMVLGANGNRTVQNALAEGTNSAGGYTVPTELLPGFLDLVRNKSVLSQAGASTVVLSTNKTSMATVLSDPTPGWRAENASVSESDLTFGQVLFQPKSLAVMVKVSRELLADSINIEEILAHTLAQAIALQLDYAGLYGSGAANQPTGLKSILLSNSRASDLATNGAKLSASGYYKPLMVSAQKVSQANDTATAAIMSARTLYDIEGFADTTGQPMQAPRWIQNNLQFLDSNSVPDNLTTGSATGITSEIFTGNFVNLLLGMRQQLELEVIRETFAANLQVAFMASLRADWQVARPNSFWLTQGVLAE